MPASTGLCVAYTPSSIIPLTEGNARLGGLDVNFTSATEVNKSFNFGSPIVDAETGEPVELPGRPTFNELTLTTPRTQAAERKIQAWSKTKDSCPGYVSAAITVGATVYSYTRCSMAQIPVSPNFDRNAEQNQTRFITMIVRVTNSSRTDIKYN